MKFLQTKRKFYNKWLYKITLEIRHCGVFRHNDVDSISKNSTLGLEVRNLATLLAEIKEYQLRIENKFVDIYLDSKDEIDKLASQFQNNIVHVCYPHPDLLLNNTSSKNIIANKLPYDRYRFKVFLKPHNMKDKDQKQTYLDWLESQNPRIFITNSTKQWFLNTDWNWDRRYMYVEDDKTLVMAKMRQSDVLGSIYTYQLTINT